jgi:uncharacterized protein with FMN-binding domain
MHKLLLAFVAMISLPLALFAQRTTEDFQISLPDQVISNSLYKTISYLDSRFDTTHMGIVQLGAFNRKARVVPKTSFSTQLTNVMNTITDSTSRNGELLFQLRQLSFAEITGAMSEKGYCFLRAALYAHINDTYQKINAIDTVLLVSSMDVTRALFRHGSKAITGLITGSLLIPAADSNYLSLTDIQKIDSIEKRKIKVYNTSAYSDGLYLNYSSFMNQVPDKQITVDVNGAKISAVKMLDEHGKKIKVKAKDVYAIVNNGQPFIATEYGYYPMQRINDDLCFTGKAKITANTGSVVAASVLFGIIGGLMASNANAVFEMKIDHINGGFIHIKEIGSTSP